MQPTTSITEPGQFFGVSMRANVLLMVCVKLAGPCYVCFAVKGSFEVHINVAIATRALHTDFRFVQSDFMLTKVFPRESWTRIKKLKPC